MSEAETKALNRERCLALAAVAQKALQVTQPGRGCANYTVEGIADSIQSLGNSVIGGYIASSSGGLHVERDGLAPEGIAVHVKLFDERKYFELPKLVEFKGADAAEDVFAALVAAAEAAHSILHGVALNCDDHECLQAIERVHDQLTAALQAAKEE